MRPFPGRSDNAVNRYDQYQSWFTRGEWGVYLFVGAQIYSLAERRQQADMLLSNRSRMRLFPGQSDKVVKSYE